MYYLYPSAAKEHWNKVHGNAAGRNTDAVPVIICNITIDNHFQYFTFIICGMGNVIYTFLN